jgi:hypothetical protein
MSSQISAKYSPPQVSNELARIEHALGVLLTACENHQPPASEIRILSVAEFCKQSPVESLLNDPIGRALRLGIKKLGGRLHELGGTDLMRSAAERVADMRRGFSGRRLSVLDHAFDGIGIGSNDFWVC